MVPAALIIGVVAGMREGSKTDRTLSAFSILTTSTPEYVSGVIFIIIFASKFGGLRWFKGTAATAMEVLKHALRNALIAPFTVIMLQIPWLLTGVVIVETLFNYKGFGWTLVQAVGNNDIELLLACSVVAVVVVLVTQLISDISYVFLNPRIRVS